MKAVGYIRVSTDEQTLSPEVQKQVITDFASARGYEIVTFFEDIGVSGGISCFLRPGFKKLLEFCEQSNVKVIFAYSIDRITRSDLDFEALVYDLIGKRGYRIITVKDGEYSRESLTPDKRIYLQLRLAIADIERYLIRIRTRDAMSKKFERGVPWGKFCKITHELEEKIVQLFRQGYSIRKIALELGVNRRVVYFILWKWGLWKLPEDTCPRCLSKMEPDRHFVGHWFCRNCGFLKPMSSATTTNVAQMDTEQKET